MTVSIHNPVLPGFNPDPYVFRDDERYHIAVSTFEWVPGVRVYGSDDLVDWSYETSVLATSSTANFAGNPDNCSVWAPSMAYHNGRYWLIYTDVKAFWAPFADVRNYIVTAENIHGPWSEPVYVNSSGFDPSLFFDDDGRAYVVNEVWDWRLPEKNKSAGILVQEFDPESIRLIGAPKLVFGGTDARMTEAPQLYRHEGWYYLMTAEGGTGLGHQVTIARSRSPFGPYEVDPAGPMLTSRFDPSLTLQCAGHASLVSTPDGEWYIAHLATRPLPGNAPILGRETALQRVVWTDDGWLRLADGGITPAETVPAPAHTIDGRPVEEVAGESRDGGGNDGIGCGVGSDGVGRGVAGFAHSFRDPLTVGPLNPARWNTLRELPGGDWLDFGADGMTIRGGASPRSAFGQHLVGTRQTDFVFEASVAMRFDPPSHMQLAGMLLYLNTKRYLFLAVTRDGYDGGVRAQLLGVEDGVPNASLGEPVSLQGDEFGLRVHADHAQADFFITDAAGEHAVARGIDIAFLSGGFTGDFIALDVVDLNRCNDTAAVFRDFVYDADPSATAKGTASATD